MRLSGATRLYLAGREARGEVVADTLSNIRSHLDDFAAAIGDPPIEYVTRRSIEIWLEVMERRGLAARTRLTRLSSVRKFARWCVVEQLVDRDWTLSAPDIRAPRQQPRDMTQDHFDRMLTVARTSRERLIVWLMFGSGLRCVEVARLDVEDYDDDARFVFVTGKAGHQRFAAVPPPVRDALHVYLAEVGHTSGPLVRQHRGSGRLRNKSISAIVARMARQAGVKIRRHDGRSAHGLRAAGASDVFDGTLDVRLVQEFLGHVDLRNVHLYTRRSRREQLRDAVDRRFDAA